MDIVGIRFMFYYILLLTFIHSRSILNSNYEDILHSFLRMLNVDERVTLFIRKTLPLGKAKTNITRKHTFQCSLSLSTLKTNLWYSGNIKILSFKCYRVKIWIIYAKFQLKLWYKTLDQVWKKFGFLMFSWGIEVKHLLKMG